MLVGTVLSELMWLTATLVSAATPLCPVHVHEIGSLFLCTSAFAHHRLLSQLTSPVISTLAVGVSIPVAIAADLVFKLDEVRHRAAWFAVLGRHECTALNLTVAFTVPAGSADDQLHPGHAACHGWIRSHQPYRIPSRGA